MLIGAGLLAVSAVLYAGIFEVFGQPRTIVFNLIVNLAFLPIQVLLVSVIVDRLLGSRERRAMLKKLNMVIGAFFSEVGTRLLRDMSALDPCSAELARNLIVKTDWSDSTFARTIAEARDRACEIDVGRGDLAALRDFLVSKRGFLLGLLENPNLLEHESFTELLWAVFHLTEELSSRSDLTRLSGPDKAHLDIDTKRAYSVLVVEWLRYMKHLAEDYPYLFSLAVRTNPFDPDARVEVG